jgi:HlyD family secretion protein
VAFSLSKKSNRIILGGAGLLVIIIAAFIVSSSGKAGSSELPTYPVKRGNFRISLTETGELKAQNSVGISAPRIRTNLQIVFLAPKGEYAQIGDTLIRFDGAELSQSYDERKGDLEIAIANLDKTRSTMANQLTDIEASYQSSQASYRIAELRLSQMQFEADVVKEEQQLSLQQSKISLEQAEKRIEQQIIINKAEMRTLELRVEQAESELAKAKRDLDRLTVIAPQPGLIVYRKIWKGGSYSEVKVGDSPWRGQGLIELPDLEIMEVATKVNEIDIAKVKVGQRALVIPDAFPDMIFTGEIIDVANLAKEDEESEANLKVFDIAVQLDSTNNIVKPGMTVSTTMIMSDISDTLYIPLDAIFTIEGKASVYRQRGGSFKPVPVELGDRNDNYVMLISGLKEGDRVCLVDPTKPFDASSWTGIESENEGEESNGSPVGKLNGASQ